MVTLRQGGTNVPFSYKPLWKLLIDKEMSKKSLGESTRISKSTLDKMYRGENVSLEVIDRICRHLNCDVSDVITYRRT
jgi:putative transcriptional regulator